MEQDTAWPQVDAENTRHGRDVPVMPPVTMHAETVLAHLEHSIAFTRAHLTQVENDLMEFKRIIAGR